MQNLCCISSTLATKFIGTLGLTTSVLMTNMLVGDFLGTKEDTNSFLNTWAILGLNWIQMLRNSHFNNRNTILICIFIYYVLLLIANACLVLGSSTRKRNFTVLWMILEIISISDQAIGLAINLSENSKYDVFNSSPWYLPMSSIHLVLSVYFWLVVYTAQKEWYHAASTNDIWNFNNSVPVSTTNQLIVSKSPSVLAQNRSIFESPRPPITPKNEEI